MPCTYTTMRWFCVLRVVNALYCPGMCLSDEYILFIHKYGKLHGSNITCNLFILMVHEIVL